MTDHPAQPLTAEELPMREYGQREIFRRGGGYEMCQVLTEWTSTDACPKYIACNSLKRGDQFIAKQAMGTWCEVDIFEVQSALQAQAAKPPVQLDHEKLARWFHGWFSRASITAHLDHMPENTPNDLADALISALPGLTPAHPVTTGPDADADLSLHIAGASGALQAALDTMPGGKISRSKFLCGFLRSFAREVIRLHTTPGAGWRDISTLPKDGTRCLVWIDIRGLHVTDRSYARVACLGATGFTDSHAGPPIANITHWMYLPEPPAA